MLSSCLSWNLNWNALLEEPGKGRARAQKHDNPEDGHDNRQSDTAWSHQKVKEQNVDDDRSEQGEGERDVAIDQEQDRRDDLEQKYHDQIIGDKERSHELASGSGRHGAGKEVEEAVQSEGEKDESKKETGDDNSDFHVSLVC
jgi:hypothetical protein